MLLLKSAQLFCLSAPLRGRVASTVHYIEVYFYTDLDSHCSFYIGDCYPNIRKYNSCFVTLTSGSCGMGKVISCICKSVRVSAH